MIGTACRPLVKPDKMLCDDPTVASTSALKMTTIATVQWHGSEPAAYFCRSDCAFGHLALEGQGAFAS